jgi:acetyltransferase-like isoleucine patch superfamily enzyme
MPITTAEQVRKLLGTEVTRTCGTNRAIDDVGLPGRAPEGICWVRDHGPPVTIDKGTILASEAGTQRLLHAADPQQRTIIVCFDAKKAMAQVLKCWFLGPPKIDIHPSARIHPTAVIGAEGQGYDWYDGRGWVKFPQVGGVFIGQGVDIGPHCTIMRAAIGTTYIASGCKIGNGVNIGHGAEIGADTLISAHVSIGGSVKIDERVKLWQGVIVREGVTIGKHAEVGMGSIVLQDIPADTVWVGNPGRALQKSDYAI